MTRNERITDILYRLSKNELFINSEDHFYKSELEEAKQMGLIESPQQIYLLTKDGLLLIKSGRTYDDFLSDLRPTKTPSANASTAKEADTTPNKSIFKNDYIKYTIIGLIVFIAGYFLSEWFKYHKL